MNIKSCFVASLYFILTGCVFNNDVKPTGNSKSIDELILDYEDVFKGIPAIDYKGKSDERFKMQELVFDTLRQNEVIENMVISKIYDSKDSDINFKATIKDTADIGVLYFEKNNVEYGYDNVFYNYKNWERHIYLSIEKYDFRISKIIFKAQKASKYIEIVFNDAYYTETSERIYLDIDFNKISFDFESDFELWLIDEKGDVRFRNILNQKVLNQRATSKPLDKGFFSLVAFAYLNCNSQSCSLSPLYRLDENFVYFEEVKYIKSYFYFETDSCDYFNKYITNNKYSNIEFYTGKYFFDPQYSLLYCIPSVNGYYYSNTSIYSPTSFKITPLGNDYYLFAHYNFVYIFTTKRFK